MDAKMRLMTRNNTRAMAAATFRGPDENWNLVETIGNEDSKPDVSRFLFNISCG